MKNFADIGYNFFWNLLLWKASAGTLGEKGSITLVLIFLCFRSLVRILSSTVTTTPFAILSTIPSTRLSTIFSMIPPTIAFHQHPQKEPSKVPSTIISAKPFTVPSTLSITTPYLILSRILFL